MAGPSVIEAANSTVHGLESTFLQTYADAAKPDPKLELVMRRNLPGKGLTHKFFFWKSVPRIRRWERGQKIPQKGFEGVQWEVQTVNFGEKVKFHYTDVDDDRTASLFPHVRGLAKEGAQLDERVFFEILSGTVDTDLLASIPTAPDGGALFATAVGGVNRFGAASGNLLTGTGTTAAQVKADYYTLLEQFGLFQDTEGRPLHNSSTVDAGIVLMFPVALLSVFEEVFEQKISQGTSAGVSNVIIDSGKKVWLWPTQYLTGNSWYGSLAGTEIKPIASILVEDLSTMVQDFTNSDETRDTGYLGFGVRMRKAYVVAEPYSIIKNSNA